MSSFINKGEFAIIKEGELRAYLQTCCGLVYQAPGIIGFAHSVVPSEYEDLYKKGKEILSEDFLITPAQGANKLLGELEKKGIYKKDITAYLFGCQLEENRLGIKNAEEAIQILEQLKIPLKFNFTKTFFDTDLKITTKKINAKLCNSNYSKDLEREINL